MNNGVFTTDTARSTADSNRVYCLLVVRELGNKKRTQRRKGELPPVNKNAEREPSGVPGHVKQITTSSYAATVKTIMSWVTDLFKEKQEESMQRRADEKCKKDTIAGHEKTKRETKKTWELIDEIINKNKTGTNGG